MRRWKTRDKARCERGTITAALPAAATFEAILRTELRENLKWAGLGLLGMSAALTYGLQQEIARSSQTYSFVDWTAFFAMTALPSACVAFMIGLAQAIPENRGDRWALIKDGA